MTARVTLLEHRMAELEDSVEYHKKKKRQSAARLQTGSVLTVEEAQDLIVQADLAVEVATEERSQQPRQRAPPTCSLCHEIRHIRTYCPTL
jgi:hypothetical protein